jgi:predicted MFS family arabinose efflux permease
MDSSAVGFATKRAWSLWVLATLFYAYQYVVRVLPNNLMPFLTEVFHGSVSQIGHFSGMYYIGYTCMHIPLGLWLDRYSLRLVLSLCMTATACGLIPLWMSDSWDWPVVGRLLTGCGSSGAVLGLLTILRRLFPEAWFGRMLGVSVTVGLVGALYGSGPVLHMMDWIGWQAATQVLALAGLVLALVFFFCLPSENPVALEASAGVWRRLRDLAKQPRLWVLGVVGGLMVGPLEGYADAWGSVSLVQWYGLSTAGASSVVKFLFVGMCVGCIVLPWIADRWRCHGVVIVVSGLLMGAGFLAVLSSTLPVSLLPWVFGVVGFFCAYQVILVTQAATLVSSSYTALATAVVNMVLMSFGFVFHTVIAFLLALYHEKVGEALHDGAYSAEALRFALMVIPVALCVGSMLYSLQYVVVRFRARSKPSVLAKHPV